MDIFYFDGASNVQKAGELHRVKFPRTVTYHGGEHAVTLWFSDLASGDQGLFYTVLLILFFFNFCTNSPLFSQKLMLKVCRCCNIVCSGANQVLYAIFLAYSKKMFGRKLSFCEGPAIAWHPFSMQWSLCYE